MKEIFQNRAAPFLKPFFLKTFFSENFCPVCDSPVNEDIDITYRLQKTTYFFMEKNIQKRTSSSMNKLNIVHSQNPMAKFSIPSRTLNSNIGSSQKTTQKTKDLFTAPSWKQP